MLTFFMVLSGTCSVFSVIITVVFIIISSYQSALICSIPVTLCRTGVTDHRQCRPVPEFLPARGLEPCTSAHFYPACTDNQQKLSYGTTSVSYNYFMPELLDTTGTLRTDRKRNGKGEDESCSHLSCTTNELCRLITWPKISKFYLRDY